MSPLAILSVYFLDLILGDPRWLPHPMRGIGKLIAFLEKYLRRGNNSFALFVKGAVLNLVTVGGCAFCSWLILDFSKKIDPFLGIVTWVFLGYTTIAIKDLFIHGRSVLQALKDKNIEKARERLSLMVGRDVSDLSQEKITTAAIESIAESTNDGIIAPLFYLVLGGPVLAIAYKAINTLDSMVGYRNERYMYFGRFSARLDDVVNFLPARITGLLMIVSSFILGKGFSVPFRILVRDGGNHSSPNSGISEAAMAGALGIRLGGPSSYEGKVFNKPYLGEERKKTTPLLINKALDISFTASLLMVLIGAGLRWLI